MWLISVVLLVPTLYMASGRELPIEVRDRLEVVFPMDGVVAPNHLALAFIVGLVVGGTPLHHVMRYLSTVVHELGHALTSGVLGGRPKNIHITPSASGLATYQPPITWGRGRASLVSIAGYPAPAIAALAAVRALQAGQGLSWFIYASGTLALAVILLIRNFWGVLWTSLVVTGAYFGVRGLSVEYLGFVVGGLAGYLSIEGYRHAWEQMVIIRRLPGSGCDAEKVAIWWGLKPRSVGLLHLLMVTAIAAYASYVAIHPYWPELTDQVTRYLKT